MGKNFNSGPEAATNLGINFALLYVAQQPETARLGRTGRSGCSLSQGSGRRAAEDLPGRFSYKGQRGDVDTFHMCSTDVVVRTRAASPPKPFLKSFARKLVSNFMCLGTKGLNLLTGSFSYD